MAATILPDMCRVCLKSDGAQLTSLYVANKAEEETPAFMLKKITGLKLEDQNLHTNKLPKLICGNCSCELQISYQFLEKALEAQAHIVDFLSKQSDEVDAATNIETNENEQKSELSHLSSPMNKEILVYIYDTDDDEPSINSENKAITANEADLNRDEDEAPTVVVAQKVSIKKLSKRGRKPKTETKAGQLEDVKCHVCEICGNVFKKRGRLTEHLRRHATVAKYACELCDERFILREALRRHMFQHLGGKPFQCKFCSRTFFYESVKKAHEAIHDGHKPYICNKCGKAFAYSQALKKHQLIHDEIKLYTCCYCQKDFRLQHHLKQHEETKAHINAVQTAKSSQKTK